MAHQTSRHGFRAFIVEHGNDCILASRIELYNMTTGDLNVKADAEITEKRSLLCVLLLGIPREMKTEEIKTFLEPYLPGDYRSPQWLIELSDHT